MKKYGRKANKIENIPAVINFISNIYTVYLILNQKYRNNQVIDELQHLCLVSGGNVILLKKK